MAWRKISLLASAARTASAATPKQYTPNVERVILFVDATTIAATETVTPTIRGYTPDPAATADDTYNVLAGAAISAAGNTAMQVGPGLTEVANVVAADNMPPVWDVNLVHSSTGSHTYSVSAWIFERD